MSMSTVTMIPAAAAILMHMSTTMTVPAAVNTPLHTVMTTAAPAAAATPMSMNITTVTPAAAATLTRMSTTTMLPAAAGRKPFRKTAQEMCLHILTAGSPLPQSEKFIRSKIWTVPTARQQWSERSRRCPRFRRYRSHLRPVSCASQRRIRMRFWIRSARQLPL